MKNTHLYLCISIFIFLVGCKKGNNQNEELSDKKVLKIDSVVVIDSLMSKDGLLASYKSSILFFDGEIGKGMLDSIYSPFQSPETYSKDSIKNWMNKDKEMFFEKMKLGQNIIPKKPKGYGIFNQRMKLISNKDGFLQILYLSRNNVKNSQLNKDFKEKIFDLEKSRVLRISDITTLPKSRLSELLLNNIDKMERPKNEIISKVKNSEMLLVDVIPVADDFYFDEQNLYFHYKTSQIAAYNAGDIIIPISWKELSGTLKDDFAERLKK